MTIYPSNHFNDIEELLKFLKIDHLYRTSWRSYLRDKNPSVYKEIMNFTSFLIDPTFTERLYCFVHKITKRPQCKMCISEVSYKQGINGHYHTYCKGKCARDDFITLIGAENPSTLQTVKDAKVKSAKIKYGVDNVSKAQEVKDTISKNNKNTRKLKFNKMLESVIIQDNTLNLTKKEYNKLVWIISNNNYRNNIDTIDPLRLRGKEYHLDHRVSRYYGFYNKIPPHIIGDINNLELLPSKENLSKYTTNSISIEELYKEYNKNNVPIEYKKGD